MVSFAVNHMTAAHAPYGGLLELAAGLGCAGVEVRNDLAGPLFDGDDPAAAGAAAREKGLRLLALAEVKAFNDISGSKLDDARRLAEVAATCGAEAVSLIPRNDGVGNADGERQEALRAALRALRPMLEDHDLIGFVEPLGFETSSLRFKAEAVEAIEELGAADRFKLVHDTFHHTLAGGGPIFPRHTGLVHLSGVVDAGLAVADMADEHRILVDGRDRLGNVDQVAAMIAGGYAGAFSFEAFSPQVHALAAPAEAIRSSMEFIEAQLMERAA